MATKSETVKLNLKITAKDEASKVFEQFASKLKTQLEEIARQMSESFNLKPALEEVQQASDGMTSSLNSVKKSAEELPAAMEKTSEEVAASTAAMAEQTQQATDSMQAGLSGLKSGMKLFELQYAGQELEQFGEHITSFFGSAIQSAAEFDQNVMNVASSLRAQGESAALVQSQIQSLNDTALQMGSDGFFSANQIAEAMNVMAKQGIDYNTIMGGALEQAKNVAAANQEDLAQTSNVISDIVHEMGSSLLQQYGTMGNALSHVGSAMTVALHHARLSMDDFLNSMKYAGPQASALGLKFSDLSAAIATLAQHGIRGTQAGTTLRRMLTNLSPTTATATAEFKKLGLITANGTNVFYKANGQLKDMTTIQGLLHNALAGLTPQMQEVALKTIFGQYALAGMTAIVQTAPGQFAAMTKAMENDGVATDILNEKKKGLGYQLNALHAHYQTLQKQIGELFKPLLESIIAVLNRAMDAVQNFAKAHPQLAKIIATVAAVGAVLTVVSGAVLVAAATFGMMQLAADLVVPALVEMLVALGPITLAIAGVVAAIAAFSFAWSHNLGGIQQKTQAVLGWVSQQFHAAMAYVGKYVMEGVHAVTKWWNQMAPTFGKAVHNVYAFIMWLSPLWKAIWAVIGFVVKSIFDNIVGVVQGAWKVLSGVFQFFGDLLAGNWSKLWGDIWRVIKGAVQLVINLFELGFVGKGISLFGKLLANFGFFGKLFGKLFTKLGRDLEAIGTTMWHNIQTIFRGALRIVLAIFDGGFVVMRNFFGAISRLMHGDVSGFWNGLKSAFSFGAKVLMDVLHGMFDMFDGLFGGLPGKALDWGANMIKMFAQGITNTAHLVIDKMKSLAKKVVGLFAFHSPPKEGPLADSDQYMPNMMKMYGEGIQKHMPALKATVGAVATVVHGVMQPNTNAINNNVNSITSTLNNYVAPANSGAGRGGVAIVINVNGMGKDAGQMGTELARVIRTQMAVVSA